MLNLVQLWETQEVPWKEIALSLKGIANFTAADVALIAKEGEWKVKRQNRMEGISDYTFDIPGGGPVVGVKALSILLKRQDYLQTTWSRIAEDHYWMSLKPGLRDVLKTLSSVLKKHPDDPLYPHIMKKYEFPKPPEGWKEKVEGIEHTWTSPNGTKILFSPSEEVQIDLSSTHAWEDYLSYLRSI